DQVQCGPVGHLARAVRKRSGVINGRLAEVGRVGSWNVRPRTTGPRHIWLRRSCQIYVVVFKLAGPVDYGTNVQTTSPSISRAVVEEAEVGPAPRQRIGQSERRGLELAGYAKSFRGRGRLKLSPGQPGAVDRRR